MPRGKGYIDKSVSKRIPGDGQKPSVPTIAELNAPFERQPLDKEMEELGVDFIHGDECEFVPFKTYRNRNNQSPLDEGLVTLNVSRISFPKDMYDAIQGKWIRFGILKQENQPDKLAWRVFDKQKEHSFAVKDGGKGFLIAGSLQVIKQIVEAGFPYGIYRPKEIKGGYIAHLVKARQIKREDK